VQAVRSYKDLEVWKLSMELAEDCYLVTKAFPREEAFGQTTQIRRAAVSIPANIAEGYGREGTASFIQCLRVAQGSQKELETHILLSQRVGLLGQDETTALLGKIESIGRMLRNLIKSLVEKQES
jgi:four helix bundle protein